MRFPFRWPTGGGYVHVVDIHIVSSTQIWLREHGALCSTAPHDAALDVGRRAADIELLLVLDIAISISGMACGARSIRDILTLCSQIYTYVPVGTADRYKVEYPSINSSRCTLQHDLSLQNPDRRIGYADCRRRHVNNSGDIQIYKITEIFVCVDRSTHGPPAYACQHTIARLVRPSYRHAMQQPSRTFVPGIC
ncbi:hypothetical protein GY45DRAFT_946835 [Cubamyces sp. BRFM 1775]|nr:hypothetical protein GY45DRAFT_946835 [Cubamyces sp. BRFM 1775]